jgi:hypothetical protein
MAKAVSNLASHQKRFQRFRLDSKSNVDIFYDVHKHIEAIGRNIQKLSEIGQGWNKKNAEFYAGFKNTNLP